MALEDVTNEYVEKAVSKQLPGIVQVIMQDVTKKMNAERDNLLQEIQLAEKQSLEKIKHAEEESKQRLNVSVSKKGEEMLKKELQSSITQYEQAVESLKQEKKAVFLEKKRQADRLFKLKKIAKQSALVVFSVACMALVIFLVLKIFLFLGVNVLTYVDSASSSFSKFFRIFWTISLWVVVSSCVIAPFSLLILSKNTE